MLDNLPLSSLKHKALTIEGYSRAAVQSYWRIPELKLGFELGGSPWAFMGTQTFFVSHAHLDHLAALPVYVARRRMMKMEPPTIYLPEQLVDSVHRLLQAWQRLDRGSMNCELVGDHSWRRSRLISRTPSHCDSQQSTPYHRSDTSFTTSARN